MIIKIGKGINFFYPFMFLLFIFLLKIYDILVKVIFNEDIINFNFILPESIFLSQIIAGLIILLFRKKEIKLENIINDIDFIDLMENRQSNTIERDSNFKIAILILFASYFNYIDIIIIINHINYEDEKINEIFNKIIDKFLHYRIKSFQLIFSAILCFLTIKKNLFKYQIVALIIIISCLLGIIFIEFYSLSSGSEYIIKTVKISLSLFSCFTRSFLDTIEKYLIEYDEVNPFKILMFEGIISLLLFNVIPLIMDFKKIKKIIFDLISSGKNQIYIFIPLILAHLILSVLRNIYRMYTIKFHWPTTRALLELILDPFILIFYYLKYNTLFIEINNLIYFIIIISLLFVINFFGLIYNDFLVLCCCGLDINSFNQIKKRNISYNINYGIIDDCEEDENSDDDNKKTEELVEKNK